MNYISKNAAKEALDRLQTVAVERGVDYVRLNGITYRKAVYCKHCKHFERDHIEVIDGVQLITAHEICRKWGGGCKTNESGYCFLYEGKDNNKNQY